MTFWEKKYRSLFTQYLPCKENYISMNKVDRDLKKMNWSIILISIGLILALIIFFLVSF
jgi:hypothetical protein